MNHSQRSRYRWVFAAAGVLAVVVIIVAAYSTGLWIPNLPSRAEFPIRGIDVSGHQSTIQWSAISPQDVQFVYIKATEGGDFRDPRFNENWVASSKAGLRHGAYHYFALKTPGTKQADNFIATVPKDASALPPAIDVEFWGNSGDRPSVEQFQHELSTYVAKVKEFYGTEPVIYTARDFQSYYLVGFPQPRLWFRAVVVSPRVFGITDWTFWQYSEKGRVRGFEGFVDQSVFQGSPAAFEALCRPHH